MFDALKNWRAARSTLAAVSAVVLVADLIVVGARASTHEKPTAIKTPVSTTSTKPKPVSSKPGTKKPPARTTKKAVAKRRAGLGCGKPADFNGDGFADLAIGIPHKDADGVRDSGAVQIAYGNKSGLAARGVQVFTQNSFGKIDSAQREDNFGAALATGDFNGDRFTDLAVGIPSKDGVGQDSGAAVVILGSASGLAAKGAQYWTQDSAGIGEDSQGGDTFGSTLTAGDYNGDGFADLVIGVPKEDVQRPGFLQADGSAGVFNAIFGSAKGLTSAGNKVISQNSLNLSDKSEGNDLFSWSLTSGDFDGDGFCDVAAGVPAQKVNGVDSAGAVNIVRGSASGFTPAGAQIWSQNSNGVLDQSESGDQFGYTLDAGDFNGDKRADLAIGVFDEGIGSKTTAGAVNVLYGSSKGITAAANQFWSLDSKGMKGGPATSGDEFSYSVTAGDFNGDGRADLAIGIPHKSFSSKDNLGNTTTQSGAGGAGILLGGRAGLTSSGSQFWYQDSPGIQDTTESGDQFGYALASGDFNHDGKSDLAIGVPDEGYGQQDTTVGGVNVIYGSKAALAAKGNQFLHQGANGLTGTGQSGDAFGAPVGS